MRSAPLHGFVWILAIGLCLALCQPSHAIFGIFRGKNKDRMPTKEEVAAHDREAAKYFAAGEDAQNSGKTKKAEGYYEKITKDYYYSKYAAEATFRRAELLKALGEPTKAFKNYQELVDRYRDSPRFRRAVEQQYNIAVEGLTQKHGSILGVVPKKLSRDRVIKMFQAVMQNAPASIYAANSQYYIARIYEGQKDWDLAIAAFQKVVDDYPRSEKAPQAQLKIGEIYEKTTRRPENPTNLRESREAYEDFITNFPQHQKQTQAVAQLNVLDEKEARKSLNVAKYYQKQGNTKAAAIYYKDVLRSSNAAMKLEARQAIDAIAKTDPEAIQLARIDENATQIKPSERLKNQRNYLGPPAPDLVAVSEQAPTRKSLVPSDVEPVPLPAELEPTLPTGQEGTSGAPPISVDELIPSPPPAEESDILGSPGGTSLSEPVPDIDSLLPLVEEEDSDSDGDDEGEETEDEG